MYFSLDCYILTNVNNILRISFDFLILLVKDERWMYAEKLWRLIRINFGPEISVSVYVQFFSVIIK